MGSAVSGDAQRWIGLPVPPTGHELLVTGLAKYVDDLAFPDALHLRLVRSFVAHARLLRVVAPTASEACIVVTAADLGAPPPILAPPYLPAGRALPGWPLLAHGRIRFAGEAIAAVLAHDPYEAEDVAEEVYPEYEELPAIVDVDHPTSDVVLHDEWPDNIVFAKERRVGDVDEARQNADVSVRRTFRTRRHTGVPIETRGCVAQVRSGQLRLWSSTQVPHLVKSVVANALRWSEDRVEVISPAVGGGFGIKGHVYPEEALVSILAVRTGKTIKWIEDRVEHLVGSVHAQDHMFDLELHLRSDGIILGLDAALTVDSGAYAVWPQTLALDVQMASAILPGPYVVPNYRFNGRAVLTNKTPTGTYRGVARPSCAFALERLIDEAAREMSLDPFEIRLRNVVRDFPYRTGTGLIYDSGSTVESLERMRKILGDSASERQPKERGDRLRGVGIACFVEQTAHIPPWAQEGTGIVERPDAAVITADDDGRVRISVGLANTGQSHETTLAQVVADRLRLSLRRVEVTAGDTRRTPFSMGTLASRAAVVGSRTASLAAERLKSRLLALASAALGVPVGWLQMYDGEIRSSEGADRFISLAEIVKRYGEAPEEGARRTISARAEYDGPDGGTFSNACHAAEVEVDPETGQVAVTRYVVVEDCGQVINPLVVEGQVHGGVAQGIGGALFERLAYDEQGQFLTATLMDYPLPSTLEVPDIETHHLGAERPIVAPVKGVGESGAIGPMAAVANAVADALGPLYAPLVREVPLGPDKVWSILHPEGGEDER